MKIFVYNWRENDEDEFFEKFAKQYGVELGYTTEYPTMENAHLAAGYEGLCIIVSDMNAEILQKFYDLGVRYITTRSVGFDHFDLKKAKELGLKISTTPYPPNSVANYAIMLMLMSCRRAKHILDRSNVQDFSLAGKRGVEISKSTVGVIGTGKIGKTVIEHLRGCGCKILAYDIYESDEVKQHAEYVDMDTLFKNSDIITMHAPSTDDNYHLIDDASIAKMKDGVIIINSARGTLVDTDALIKGLENGKIGAAGLDVIENEFGLYYMNLSGKVIENTELAVLRSFPNVIVTPHTAFYTDEAVSHMVENGIRGCVLFKEGKENPYRVC